MQTQLQFQSEAEAFSCCEFLFFAPEVVADGGGYSWKLFKAVDKASRSVFYSCFAAPHPELHTQT
jgi:hypothetical protein